MVISITLDAINETGNKQGYPTGPAKLGFFVEGETKTAAENVFVLVVHYDFKYGVGEWPRPGDEQDVENLRKTFAENRNCAFRECSPKREDLLALLQDEQKLKRFFRASEVPDVFFLIILSHGAADGVIFTDTHRSPGPNDYEYFTTRELFKSLKNTFPKSLKTVILGPCRGLLEDVHPSQVRAGGKNEPQESQNPTRVSFEPKMRNLTILYSTVETTYSARNEGAGTWLIKFLCNELNEIRQDQGLVQFLTGVQNRIHRESFGLHEQTGQTPEFKFFPCVRKFVIRALPSSASKIGTNSNSRKIVRFVEKPRSIHFDWIDPQTDKVLRGRRALIFHQGEENKLMKKLDSVLVMNLGFETTRAKLDKDGLNYYFSQSHKSWTDYGCFAAFLFAKVTEQEEGEVCINLNENKKIPIGELIHRLLGPKNTDWVGKPKLFFLIDTQVAATDSTPKAKSTKAVDTFRVTNHSGWLLFVLRNMNSLEKFVDIFQNQEIKRTKSLQESLSDLIVEKNIGIKTPKAMMVSTLPHLLFFPILERNFIQPEFRVEGKGFQSEKEVEWKDLLKSEKIKESNCIWLLSSVPGSGKSTVMRELAFEMQRTLKGEIKVFRVVLYDTFDLFSAAKKKRKVPSLASVVSHATGNREMEIQNLIEQKKIMLMFDGFDEICPFNRDQVLQIFTEAVKEKVPIWISTRPHEEAAIRAKLEKGNRVSRVQIMPLDLKKQIEHLMMISNKCEEECTRQITFYRENGLEDILRNPLHLKMIAELPAESDYKQGTNLYEMYERIVHKKIRLALTHFSGPLLEKALISGEKELKIAAAQFLCNRKSEVLKNTNNEIVTIGNGRAQFVHQTFAEFLAAAHFVDCLLKEEEEMPFDIFKDGFRQVRKFADMKVSTISEKSNFPTRMESYLKKLLTKSILKDIILKEKLGFFGTAAANLVTFNPTKSKGLNFVADQILELASSENENFALALLKNGAYENLAEPNTAAVKILVNAIENNFAYLFTAISEKCANLIELVWNNETIREAVEKACKKNYRKVLRLVFEKGIIGSNYQDALNVALKSAVQENSTECVELLIKNGAPTADFDEDDFEYLNIKTTEAMLKTKDEPVLKLASRIFNRSIESANAKVAKFLFDKFSDVENAEFEVSSRALIDVARWSHDYETAQMLCHWLLEKRGFQVREKDKYGRNAFHCAVEKGNKGLVKYFLEKDPALTKTLTNEGENAMHLILRALDSERKIEMCKYLNNLDAEMVKQKNAQNKTILHLAAQVGKLVLCEWLVEEIGLEVDAVDDCGWNAMHFAASDYNVEIKLLEYLHEKSPQLIEKRTNKNETALHLVAKNEEGKVNIYNWFVKKGVDESVQNSEGKTALQEAHEYFLTEFKLKKKNQWVLQ
ncbi:uncharacterized protein LOC132193825 isoform X2 [Neocloeon triangulifer]|uniref:uncharacterized protein LOC132193825 isoform X2 n=1 Tax=Neocloeon triangulifer TaxID=2078957 RepID=UPI00286F04AF|nr:uncharacterized protein LOC132193825 isoform X2 [Neocloeon triangulifer]